MHKKWQIKYIIGQLSHNVHVTQADVSFIVDLISSTQRYTKRIEQMTWNYSNVYICKRNTPCVPSSSLTCLLSLESDVNWFGILLESVPEATGSKSL